MKLPDEINIVWSIEDIKGIDSSLSDEQARQILQLILTKHDATIGVNWDVIQHWIDYFKNE